MTDEGYKSWRFDYCQGDDNDGDQERNRDQGGDRDRDRDQRSGRLHHVIRYHQGGLDQGGNRDLGR